MAKKEKRALNEVVAELKRLAGEWAEQPHIEPGSQLHAMYVQVMRNLLAESQKCER
jgi:hypothetical protein